MLGMPPLYKRGTDCINFGFDNDQPKGKVVRGAGCELRGASISITKFTELWWNDGVFEGTEEHLRVFWKLSIIWDFYGMTKWLRQAQPPEFDGLRYWATWTSFADLQSVLNHQLKLWGDKIKGHLKKWLRQAQPPEFDRLSHRNSTGSATGIRQAQPPEFDGGRYRTSTILSRRDWCLFSFWIWFWWVFLLEKRWLFLCCR